MTNANGLFELDGVMTMLHYCPFCGGKGKVVKNKVCAGHGDFYTKFYVVCDECNAKGPSFNDYMKYLTEKDLEAMAIKGWNRRAGRIY